MMFQSSFRRIYRKTGVRNFNNFLKLNSCIINKAHIKEITHYNSYETEILKQHVPARYIITMANEKIDGFNFWACGWVNSRNREYTICSENNPTDYAIIQKEWSDKTQTN